MTVDGALGRRIERSLAGCARHYANDHRRRFPQHGAEVLEVGGAGGGLAVWASPCGAPNVSRAFALGTDGEVTIDDLARIEAFYARHDAGVRVVTSPWAHESLFRTLAARGYVVASFLNILVRDLATAGELAPARPAPGVSVTRVAAGEEVAWGRIVREGFGPHPSDEHDTTIDGAFEGAASAALFVASADGSPAGGGALVMDEGMGVLFATSTLPSYRRRGVHAALVMARLAHARDSGADIAVVITDPGSDSQRNLEASCGFRLGYCEVMFEGPT